MRREHALRILSAHQHEIREKGVTRLALFGSTARDQARTDSDVDLLVDYDGEGRSAQIWDITTVHIHPLRAAVLAMIDEVEKRG